MESCADEVFEFVNVPCSSEKTRHSVLKKLTVSPSSNSLRTASWVLTVSRSVDQAFKSLTHEAHSRCTSLLSTLCLLRMGFEASKGVRGAVPGFLQTSNKFSLCYTMKHGLWSLEHLHRVSNLLLSVIYTYGFTRSLYNCIHTYRLLAISQFARNPWDFLSQNKTHTTLMKKEMMTYFHGLLLLCFLQYIISGSIYYPGPFWPPIAICPSYFSHIWRQGAGMTGRERYVQRQAGQTSPILFNTHCPFPSINTWTETYPLSCVEPALSRNCRVWLVVLMPSWWAWVRIKGVQPKPEDVSGKVKPNKAIVFLSCSRNSSEQTSRLSESSQHFCNEQYSSLPFQLMSNEVTNALH